jgi:hypothetical protein
MLNYVVFIIQYILSFGTGVENTKNVVICGGFSISTTPLPNAMLVGRSPQCNVYGFYHKNLLPVCSVGERAWVISRTRSGGFSKASLHTTRGQTTHH